MSVTISGSGQIIKQVVQVVKTDTFTTTVTFPTMADVTGLSASITPTNSANKILVLATFAFGSADSFNYARLTRNGSAIFIADAAGSRPRLSAGAVSSASAQYSIPPTSINYIDSPATTSAVTYAIQISSYNGSLTCINRTSSDRDTASYDPRSVSSIILMEVAYA